MASEVFCPHLARFQRFVHGIANDLRVARQVHAPQHVDGGEEDGRLFHLI